MTIPRDVSGARLADFLCAKWQYARVHQVGSDIILELRSPSITESPFRITIVSDSERSLRSFALSPSIRVSSVTRSSRTYRRSVVTRLLVGETVAVHAAHAAFPANWIRRRSPIIRLPVFSSVRS
jgi:hypothetical protein